MAIGMSRDQTILLEEGMRDRSSRIPPDQQCRKCGGAGQVNVGCAKTHAIYGTCGKCEGSGRNKLPELNALKECLASIRLIFPEHAQMVDGLLLLIARECDSEEVHRFDILMGAIDLQRLLVVDSGHILEAKSLIQKVTALSCE